MASRDLGRDGVVKRVVDLGTVDPLIILIQATFEAIFTRKAGGDLVKVSGVVEMSSRGYMP